MSWLDFAISNQSAGALSQLTDLSRQVVWKSQLMASRLADLSQASEASQISYPRPRWPRLRKKKMHSALNTPSCKYENPTSPIVGTCRKRLTIIPTNNCRLTALPISVLKLSPPQRKVKAKKAINKPNNSNRKNSRNNRIRMRGQQPDSTGSIC